MICDGFSATPGRWGGGRRWSLSAKQSKVVPEREAVEGRDFFTAEDAENAAAVAEFIEASKVAPERAAAEGGP